MTSTRVSGHLNCLRTLLNVFGQCVTLTGLSLPAPRTFGDFVSPLPTYRSWSVGLTDFKAYLRPSWDCAVILALVYMLLEMGLFFFSFLKRSLNVHSSRCLSKPACSLTASKSIGAHTTPERAWEAAWAGLHPRAKDRRLAL